MRYLFLLSCFFISAIFCEEVKNQIYYEFPNQSVSHCIRRLNRTSSIGCSSKASGNVGIIELVYNQSHFISKLSQIKDDTILVISSNLFIEKNLIQRLFLNKHIQGLMIFENDFCNETFCEEDIKDSFSEDYKIPNRGFSFSLNHTFNPAGSEFGFMEWPFPVAYINKRYRAEQNKIISCYNKFNKNPTSNRRCALQIRNFMAAVKDAETSIKYQSIQNRFAGQFNNINFFTDFTGMNYYVHAKENVKSRLPNSTIVLISRLDSLSMFERSAVSVNGAITSTALLLSVMKLLMSQPEFKKGENLAKDVLFIFLDNESYDYLGSNRFIIDLKAKQVARGSSMPLNLTHLDLLLEFGELAYSNFSQFNLFYPHSQDLDKDKMVYYVNKLNNQLQRVGFRNTSDNQNLDLPPSSSQFLLRHRMVPSIVLADHQSSFLNPFYNSFLDKRSAKNNSKELAAIVNAVASFVFKEATGNNLNSSISDFDEYSPSKIIECFADNLLCDLLKEVLPISTLNKLQSLGTPIPTQAHSSTKDIPSDYRFSNLVQNLIIYLSGQRVNDSVCAACHPSCVNRTFITSGNNTKKCYKIRLDAYDEFSFNEASIPLWLTSTIVDRQSVRMFVLGPNLPLLATGIVLTLAALLLMTLTSSRMSFIFYKSI